MGMIKLPQDSITFFKKNLDEIFLSGNLAEGKWNRNLSDHVKHYCNVRYAIPTSSNGSGLVALLLIYKTYFNRTHVLLQSNTMYGVKTMVNSAGCELSGYIDCLIETLMPSIDQVEEAVKTLEIEKERLIILLSHIGGIINPDIEKISTFCKARNIILLEDCAHSYGAVYKGNHSGTFGDAGVYSFYATKSIPAGEGGIAITNNDEIGEYLTRFIIYDRFIQQMSIGNNNRPSEVQALLIYSVLLEADRIIANKKQISDLYIEACNNLNIPYINQKSNNFSGNYYKFIVYNKNLQISNFLPRLKTKTSSVYDYSLGHSTKLTTHHACLPIWYGQESEITNKVVKELYESKSLA